MNAAIKFELPSSLHATMPPERRNVRRDFVKMMVLDRRTGKTSHTQFYHLEHFLKAGDVLVLNSSRTVPAVLKAKWMRGSHVRGLAVEVRLARRLNDSSWEVLVVSDGVETGDILIFSSELQAKVSNTTHHPFVTLNFSQFGTNLYDNIYTIGEPIRYEYIEQPWSLDYYQTVFASAPGSVEMPSAGRAFSWELLFKLKRKGIRIAYVQLHTGLSYLLDDKIHLEPLDHFEEFSIPEETAIAIEQSKQSGGRVIAVGTTVVRALESSADEYGRITPYTGWTNLQIEQDSILKIVDGLVTGFHEPEASHLDLLSAFIDPKLLMHAYEEAIDRQYLWHEFGDMNFII